jgi:hypothetical protein
MVCLLNWKLKTRRMVMSFVRSVGTGSLALALIHICPMSIHADSLSFSKTTVYENCFADSSCSYIDHYNCIKGTDSVMVTNRSSDTVFIDTICLSIEKMYAKYCRTGPDSLPPVFAVQLVSNASSPPAQFQYQSLRTSSCFPAISFGYSGFKFPPKKQTKLSCFILAPCFSCPTAKKTANAVYGSDTVTINMGFKTKSGETHTMSIIGKLNLTCSLKTMPPHSTLPQKNFRSNKSGPWYTIKGQVVEKGLQNHANLSNCILISKDGEKIYYENRAGARSDPLK